MVVVFSLIGCHISLTKAVEDVEEAFFNRMILATVDYYTCPGDQLTNCVRYANRLMSVISGASWADDVYEQIGTARLALDSALDSRDISDICQANQALVEAVAALEALVAGGAALPESTDDYDAIISDFHSAQSVASVSPYNDYVDTFTAQTLEVFPTNILRRLAFVAAPEKFE